MKKSKVARLAGFIGALGVSTVLVTMAVQGTGAYFTDSVDGNLQASSGILQITASGTHINFAGLNPGEDRSQTVSYTVKSSSTTKADIWLVFNPNTAAYGQFTGAKDASGDSYNGIKDGGMGQYGHFKVSGTAGTFESYNLQLPAVDDAMSHYSSTTARNTCNVDADGHGGSSVQHALNGNNDIAECGVPAAILLTKNLAPGHSATASVIFGMTGKQTDQNQKDDPNVPFQIVATQPGEYPLTSAGAVGSNW